MEIIKSNRGGDKLCVDDYVYVKKKSQKNWIRWQCQHQRSAGCKGGVSTDANYDNPRSLLKLSLNNKKDGRRTITNNKNLII